MNTPSHHPRDPQTHRLPVRGSGQAGTVLSGPGEIVTAIPHLLGFHPHRSLVLVGLRESGPTYRLVVTARLDLPDSRGPALTQTLNALHRGGVTHAVAILYPAGPDPENDNHDRDPVPHEQINLLDHTCTEQHVRLVDALLVDDDRWSSLLCTDPRCCPPLGRPVHSWPAHGGPPRAVARRRVAGSRAALADQLAPAPDRDRLQPALQRRAHLLGTSRSCGVSGADLLHAKVLDRARRRPSYEGDPQGLTDAEVVDLAAALADTEIRDRVWLEFESNTLPASALWAELARLVPSPWDGPPLFLHAWQSWRAGDGATANIALERCLHSDPTYNAAHLLAQILRLGISPDNVPQLSAAPDH